MSHVDSLLVVFVVFLFGSHAVDQINVLLILIEEPYCTSAYSIFGTGFTNVCACCVCNEKVKVFFEKSLNAKMLHLDLSQD